MSAVIEVRDLRKVYEPTPRWMRMLLREPSRAPIVALDGISFSLDAGQICAVVGPNGAGKSTLFRILTGLTTPTEGSASMLGRDVASPTPAIRRTFGFMPPDDRSLYLRQTCRENLAFHGRLHGMRGAALDARIAEVLDMVNLSHAADRTGFALSSGMRARLMFARAIFHEPAVLILDEPTGATDPVASYELLETIKQTAREMGAAVLLSSHRLEEIESLHENAILMDRGRIAYRGDIDDLAATLARPVIDVTFRTAGVAAAAMQRLDAMGVEVLDRDGAAIRVRSDDGPGHVLTSLDGHLGSVESISEGTMPLRDVLMQVLGGSR